MTSRYTWRNGVVSAIAARAGVVDATDFDDDTGAEPAIETLVEGDAVVPIGKHKETIEDVYRCLKKMDGCKSGDVVIINGVERVIP